MAIYPEVWRLRYTFLKLSSSRRIVFPCYMNRSRACRCCSHCWKVRSPPNVVVLTLDILRSYMTRHCRQHETPRTQSVSEFEPTNQSTLQQVSLTLELALPYHIVDTPYFAWRLLWLFGEKKYREITRERCIDYMKHSHCAAVHESEYHMSMEMARNKANINRHSSFSMRSMCQFLIKWWNGDIKIMENTTTNGFFPVYQFTKVIYRAFINW